MNYEKPMIVPVDAGGGDVKPMACTWLAIVLAVIIAAAGAYVGVGYAYAAGAALAVGAAVWYAAIGAGCG